MDATVDIGRNPVSKLHSKVVLYYCNSSLQPAL